MGVAIEGKSSGLSGLVANPIRDTDHVAGCEDDRMKLSAGSPPDQMAM